MGTPGKKPSPYAKAAQQTPPLLAAVLARLARLDFNAEVSGHPDPDRSGPGRGRATRPCLARRRPASSPSAGIAGPLWPGPFLHRRIDRGEAHLPEQRFRFAPAEAGVTLSSWPGGVVIEVRANDRLEPEHFIWQGRDHRVVCQPVAGSGLVATAALAGTVR